MEVKERILEYLSIYGKENNHRIASALKLSGLEVTEALIELEKEGKIEIKGGRAFIVKEKELKARPKKQRVVTAKEEEVKAEEQPKEELKKEQLQIEEEISEEKMEEAEPTKEGGTYVTRAEEKKIEGTVKFFNHDKGFGFITGDDGQEYYVNKSALKEGITIEANDRVSFKVIQGDKGLKAEEIEWVSQ